jgi:hypothetical protein
MENFNLKKYLTESKMLNEDLMTSQVSLEVKKHLESALNLIEKYKELNQIPSNESPFNDVEVDIEGALFSLGHME